MGIRPWLVLISFLAVADALFVYRYFQKNWPNGWDCPEQDVGIANLSKWDYRCKVNGSAHSVRVINPYDFKITVHPEKDSYSSSDGSVEVKLSLKDEPFYDTWMKIEAASEYGDSAPKIKHHTISWSPKIRGTFKYYVVTPFVVYGVVIKIDDDVKRYPSTDAVFYSTKFQTGVYFYNKEKVLDVVDCSTLNPAVKTEIDDNLVKFNTTEKNCFFTLICKVKTEKSEVVTHSASLLLLAQKDIHYFPPFWSAYNKSEKTCPLTVDRVINNMDCLVGGKKLNDPDNALGAKCNLTRFNITCGSPKVLQQYVALIEPTDFNFKWTQNTNPYKMELQSDRLKLEDLQEYRCWWVTLNESAVVDVTGQMNIEHERFCIRCVGFIENRPIMNHLYPPEMAREALTIKLENNEKNYVIGEKASPIYVRGYDDTRELPPESIFCKGPPTFKSPQLLVQNIRTEGDMKVVCYAISNNVTGNPKEFTLGFYSSVKFSVKTVQMTSQVFVIPTYENGTNWAHLNPNREVPNMCDVKCTQPIIGTTFTNILELAKLKRNYEFYQCDCVRKRRTDLNAKRYRFLIKEQLIIYRNSTYNCKLDVPREVVLGLKTTKAETRMASYRIGSDKACPPIKCEPLGEVSNPAYKWSMEDAAGYLDEGYNIPLGYITWGCQGIPVTVYQYDNSSSEVFVNPPEVTIIPEFRQSLQVSVKSGNQENIPIHRCYFPEFISKLRSRGEVEIRSFYTEKFTSKISCQKSWGAKVFQLTPTFTIIPFSQVEATILPFIDRILKFNTNKFTCSVKPPDVINIYPVSMSWTVDGVLKQMSNTSVLRVSPEKAKSKPEIHIVACFLGNRTIKTMEFLVYGSTKPEAQVLPPKRPFFLQRASKRIDSMLEIRPPSLRTYGDYTIKTKVGTKSQEADIYMNNTCVGKHQTNLKTIYANEISLEVSPDKTIFIFENLEDSKIITCTTTTKLENVYRFFQPQWEESMIDFAKSKASIRGENLTISSKLLDGQFCYRCVIPKLQEASPFKRHCFTVVYINLCKCFANARDGDFIMQRKYMWNQINYGLDVCMSRTKVKKRLQVALVPSREGNIYPIENTPNVSCIVRYDDTNADRIPPKLKCALKDSGDVFSNIQGYTVNGSILVHSNAERVKAEVDAEIMEYGGASSGLSTKKVTIWFAREEDLEIDFPGAHGAYAKASTFTQLCTFKWAELGEAFKQNFTWKAFGKNQTVNNQRAPTLLVRNEPELNNSYFCQFSGLNKSKALKYKIIDLEKLKFSTKAKHIYRTGDKNHTIICEVEPPEAELLPNFSYGWQVRHVSKTLDVQDYNDGAHHMVCSSPASKVAKLKWAFYVVKNHVNLAFEPEPKERYGLQDTLPTCVWKEKWMNLEDYLRPTLWKTGEFTQDGFDGKMQCEFKKEGYTSSISKKFSIEGLDRLEMQIEPTITEQVFPEKEEMVFTCSVDSNARQCLQPNIFWQINETWRLESPNLNLAILPEGAYNLTCVTDAGTKTEVKPVYIVSPEAHLVIARDNKTTFFTTETQPTCQWSSEWMNKHSIFKVTGTASSNSDGAVEHRTMVCAYSKSNLKRNATYEVAIVARENVQLRLTYNGHAFTKDEQPVECYTYPTFPSENKYIRWEIIQEHPHFKMDRNKLVPSNLHVKIKDHTYGSYVCVFETEGIFLTQVFFVLTYVEMEKVKILPQKREFETGDVLSCTSTAAHTAYHILDVSMAYSNVRLISRKSGAFQVVTDTLYSVRVICSVEQQYLTETLSQQKAVLRALFRSKKPVSLQPENKTMIDEKTLLYCAYGSQTQVVGMVQLEIFLGPTTRSGNTTSKSSQLSFDEESLLGGRYFVTCVVIVGGRPWWASIREVDFCDAPEYPYLEKDEIYGSEEVNCMSKAYPVHGRLLKAETNDRNGGIDRCGSSYCFTIYSVYGYYNVQCTFEGAHEAVGFTFVKTLNATYIGPEYVPTLQRHSDLAAYALDTFIFIECFLLVLLLGLFTILGKREQKERLKQLTMHANQKSREYKLSILKDLDGQYVNVDMMEFTKNDHLRLVTMTTLFDGCYDQFAKKIKKAPEKEPATETRPTYRATVRKAMSKLLIENFNETSSSSEDEYDTETGTEVSRSGNNPFFYDNPKKLPSERVTHH